jgi:hypothetical protein
MNKKQILVLSIFFLIFILPTILKIAKASDADFYSGCTSNSDCGTCGSGDYAGNYTCINGYCTLTCNSQGNS